MSTGRLKVAVYDTKPYDKEFLLSAKGSDQIDWSFFEFRLDGKTKESAKGHDAVCPFVNDLIDAVCLKSFAEFGIRLIALRATGFNNIDLNAAHQLKLPVTRVASYSPNSVAEHAVGLLLALNRKIPLASKRVHNFNFSINGLMGFDICNKTVGVIGTGNIGKIFSQIMKGFGANVIACDIIRSNKWANEKGIVYVSMDELLEKSDIVSLHVPLLPETTYLIDEMTISKMKHGAILINTSRGKVVKTSALLQALKTGQIRGAALDTYEKEAGVFFEDMSGKNFQDEELSELLSSPNIVITAHQGFFTKEAMSQIARTTVENLMHLKNNTPFIEGTLL